MIHEKSCGVVVYHIAKSGIAEILLLHYPEGHWDFPKGHVEEGEEELDTALRELEEETGINDAEIIGGFKEKMHYFFTKREGTVSKTVWFFLAESKHKNVKISHEHVDFEWLPYKEALERLTFENARAILKKAKQFLA
ncbi:diadenosine tetraphosphate hydrolase [bacterium]|nr:diadenosine tetraphosphate hydrolase [bacterium]